MADTSNKFSLNGLNRQKRLSGLYARSPDHIEEYFDRVSLNLPPMYVRVLGVNILNYGNDQYSYGTKAVFPQPEHPNGIRAKGYVQLEVTKNSFTITNPGSGFNIGDIFNVLSLDNNIVAWFSITSTNSNGGILDFSIIPIENDYLMTPTYTVNFENNNTPSITFNPNRFRLSRIILSNFGHGYQTFETNARQQPKVHNVVLTNTGNGSGHEIITTHQPLVITEYEDYRKQLNYKNQYGLVKSDKKQLSQMHIILNDTL